MFVKSDNKALLGKEIYEKAVVHQDVRLKARISNFQCFFFGFHHLELLNSLLQDENSFYRFFL